MATIARNGISIALVTALLATGAAPALAATQVSDMVGMRGGSIDGEMERRGFSLHHAAPSGDGEYTYWWKAQDKSCARIFAREGKVGAAKLVSVSDCGQKSGDAGAAAAVAAAAIIGAIALSSKSHHRNDQYNEDSRQLAEFDRGHRDGLYNEAYHNYGNTQAYKDGYNSGVQERQQQTRHRAGRRGWGGYNQYVAVADLNYQDREYALTQLYERGFRPVGDYEMGGGQGHSYTYYNQNSHQCIHLTTRSGKVQSLEDINEGNCR